MTWGWTTLPVLAGHCNRIFGLKIDGRPAFDAGKNPEQRRFNDGVAGVPGSAFLDYLRMAASASLPIGLSQQYLAHIPVVVNHDIGFERYTRNRVAMIYAWYCDRNISD